MADVKLHEPLAFDVIGTGLGFPEGPVITGDGSVLVVDTDSGRVLRVRDAEVEVEVVAEPGGGPNGLALGPDGHGYVANNGGFLWTEVNGVRIPIDHPTHTNEPPGFTGGWIERIDLATGAVTVLHRACDGRPLRGPNDLVFDDAGGLWFTDHGKGRRASVDRGGLYYLPARGDAVREVAFPLLGPNGVGSPPPATACTSPRPSPGGCGPGTSTGAAPRRRHRRDPAHHHRRARHRPPPLTVLCTWNARGNGVPCTQNRCASRDGWRS